MVTLAALGALSLALTTPVAAVPPENGHSAVRFGPALERAVPPASPEAAVPPDPSAPATPEPPGSSETAEAPDNALDWTGWSRMTGDWGTARKTFEESGLTFTARQVVDVSRIGRAAPRAAGVGRGLIDFNVTLDLGPLARIEGGTFFAQDHAIVGTNGGPFARAFQGVSNIDADPFHHLGEVWDEQQFAGSRIRIKAGRVDANTEFAVVESAAEFINPSYGYSPTIFTLPTYPEPALSLNVFATPRKGVHLGAGVYRLPGPDGDADQDDAASMRRLFAIGEVGVSWRFGGNALGGRATAGLWHQEQGMARFDGGYRNAITSPYFVVEQSVWRRGAPDAEETPSVTVFGQYGYADEHVSAVQHHGSVGMFWAQPFASRPHDVLGLGATIVHFTRFADADNHGSEIDVGPFYKFQVTPWLSVKPDLQVIRNPGGLRRSRAVLAGTLRMEVEF